MLLRQYKTTAAVDLWAPLAKPPACAPWVRRRPAGPCCKKGLKRERVEGGTAVVFEGFPCRQ